MYLITYNFPSNYNNFNFKYISNFKTKLYIYEDNLIYYSNFNNVIRGLERGFC